ncbi:hypothetical protein CcCBS67573_g04862 [Chytriomyces confervae]|uniref:Uncharacterized protein n=1 Tax=Chytriomyces confervae TaxID=246404 RepID=A0A507FE67_9FUNG|nr:hypothetical protein CcCBS67573_g04862 [Chytriomyces confervae]
MSQPHTVESELPARELELTILAGLCALDAVLQFVSLRVFGCAMSVAYALVLFYAARSAGGLRNGHVVRTVAVMAVFGIFTAVLSLRVLWGLVWGLVLALIVPHLREKQTYIPI